MENVKGLEVVEMKVDDLKPYEKNARKHGERDVKAIAASIEEFGFNDPVGIWSDENLIVEGHGRVLAAKMLGMETVPCIRLDHLTDEQRRAYALAHNKTAENSIWDATLVAAEINRLPAVDMSKFGFDLKKLITTQEITEDEYDEPTGKKEPRAKRGEIYKLGRHRLMCGDAANQQDVVLLMGGGAC